MAGLIAGELGKSLVELVGDGLVLLLFVHQLVLESVHLLLQLLHRSLSELGTGLGLGDT